MFALVVVFAGSAQALFSSPTISTTVEETKDTPIENIYRVAEAFIGSPRVVMIRAGDTLTYVSSEIAIIPIDKETACLKILIEYKDAGNDGWGNGDKITYLYRVDGDDVRFVDEQKDGEINSYIEKARQLGVLVNTTADDKLYRIHNFFRIVSETIIKQEGQLSEFDE